MRTIYTTIFFLFAISCARSQQLNQVSFLDGANLTYFSFLTDQGVLIRISDQGKILEWGNEVQSQRYNNYYAPSLQPWLGRVDYYGPEADSVSRGKLKSIGTCSFTYYGPYEEETKIGKLRSIGSVLLDYYSNFDNKALRGKIRFVGHLILEYYSSLGDEAVRGKIKAIGNTPITYYSTFDDKLITGKVKSIGTVIYSWYASFDRPEWRGNLKSGSYRQNINGVTYILR
jgi:hypothetical protein